jgi:hypothetical protein
MLRKNFGLPYYCFIYDKSSISVCFSQMTFVLNFALYWYDLRKDILRRLSVSHVLQLKLGWLYT